MELGSGDGPAEVGESFSFRVSVIEDAILVGASSDQPVGAANFKKWLMSFVACRTVVARALGEVVAEVL